MPVPFRSNLAETFHPDLNEQDEEIALLQERVNDLTVTASEGSKYCKTVDKAIEALSKEIDTLDLSMTARMAFEDRIRDLLNALDDVKEAIAFV